MAPIDISKLVNAATPEDREAAATEFGAKVGEVGAVEAKKNGTFEALATELADKGKAKANARAGALAGLTAILAKCGATAEPYVAPMLPKIIEACSDKLKPVTIEADKCAKALCQGLSANAVVFVLPFILAEADGKWQGNLIRCELLTILAKKNPAQIERELVEIVPVASGLIWDTKPAVKTAAEEALNAVMSTMNNKDVKGFVPKIIECIMKPEIITETVHALAGVVFVAEVFASALAVMAPLLKRGFDENLVATKRNCARITENMAKLVDDPYEVEPFVPMLLPALAHWKEEVADPECRNVCEAAHDQVKRTADQPPVWKRVERSTVTDSIKAVAAGLHDDVVAYAGALAHSMLALKNLKPDEWNTTLGPFIKDEKAIASMLETLSAHVKVEEEKEEADDAEQLCDCQFSLAYGNKVLLNQTVLKLKRGYRYGLCGKNDSGKTTLMRAIADQQVEGFPPADELRTMFVETDVQGEVAPDDPNDERLLTELSVLDFVANHAGLKKYGVTEEMAREKLLSVGFYETEAVLADGTMPPATLQKLVGRLSGGWRMKVALTRAMLMKADILLLDEPTNHLDPGNVKWVIDYLTSLSHVTSIIVSHDIKVLDQVCTHVLQIDNLKLKQYKGNLTEVANNYVHDLIS